MIKNLNVQKLVNGVGKNACVYLNLTECITTQPRTCCKPCDSAMHTEGTMTMEYKAQEEINTHKAVLDVFTELEWSFITRFR